MPFSGNLTLHYDAQADSYTMSDGTKSMTFPESSYLAEDSNDDFVVYDIYRGDEDFDTLTLLRPGTNGVINLTYVTYGYWQSRPDSTRSDFTYFVGGVQTPVAEMPLTGSASYSGVADGLALVGGQAYALFGSTGTLAADFGTGTVSTSLTLRGNPNIGEDFAPYVPGTVALGTLTGTGTIGAGSNKYSGTLSGAGMSGGLDGAFFGPGAAETGYSFQVQGGNDRAIGVFVGKKGN